MRTLSAKNASHWFVSFRPIQVQPTSLPLFPFHGQILHFKSVKKTFGEKKVFRKVENFMSGCKSKKDIFKMQFQSRVSAKKAAETF